MGVWPQDRRCAPHVRAGTAGRIRSDEPTPAERPVRRSRQLLGAHGRGHGPADVHQDRSRSLALPAYFTRPLKVASRRPHRSLTKAMPAAGAWAGRPMPGSVSFGGWSTVTDRSGRILSRVGRALSCVPMAAYAGPNGSPARHRPRRHVDAGRYVTEHFTTATATWRSTLFAERRRYAAERVHRFSSSSTTATALRSAGPWAPIVSPSVKRTPVLSSGPSTSWSFAARPFAALAISCALTLL